VSAILGITEQLFAMKHSLMPEIAKLRMKALNFWDKHGIRAAADAFGVSTRTLYWWRWLSHRGPQALIPSKAPLVRRSRHWHPDVTQGDQALRTELPNLGKEQIFVRLKAWCEARHFTCPTSTIGRSLLVLTIKCGWFPFASVPEAKSG
jgi:hypothetical protein